MNLKVKFALLFSSLVFIILFSSVALIYVLYANNREDDFRSRLKAECLQEYQLAYNVGNLDKKVMHDIKQYFQGNMEAQNTVILDSAYNVVFTPNNAPYNNIDYKLLDKIKQQKEYDFSDDKREGVGIYIKNDKHECIVITTAEDKAGLRKLHTLRLIIIIVLFAGFIMAAIAGFIYMRQLMKPLERLSSQMQGITEKNLRERVEVSKGHRELQHIANNFNDMLDRLQKGFEFQKSFVNHASHELRTPLAAMHLQTEAALRKNISGDEVTKLLHSLCEDQQDMIDLTNSLLLLSQYENIAHSNDWPHMRLDEILYDTISSVKRMLEGVNISLEFSELPDNELALSINANEALLRSAFRNLIKNAFNYSDNKTVAIIIEANAQSIQLHFINNGKVLTQEEQERMFIPFFRGQNSQQKKGFGLGLTIVMRIVRAHKGEVIYKAINNNQNCFTVSFTKQHLSENDEQ